MVGWLGWLALSVLLLGLGITQAAIPSWPLAIGPQNAFLLATFAAGNLFAACAPLSVSARALWGLVGAGLAGLALAGSGLAAEPWGLSTPVVVVSSFGLAGLIALGVDAVRADGQRRVSIARFAATSYVLTAFVVLSPYALDLTVAVDRSVLDPRIFVASSAFGFGSPPSQWMGQLFADWPWLGDLCQAVHSGLPLGLGVVAAVQLRSRELPAVPLGLGFALVGAIGLVSYLYVPVVGPLPFFGDAWTRVEPTIPLGGFLSALTTDSLAPRNCMPSLHTAWGVLLAVHGYRLGRAWAAFGALFLLLTLMATLGIGAHYIVDLFAGLCCAAWAYAIQSPTHPTRERWLFGALFVLWMVVPARWPLELAATPLVAWACGVVTVVVVWVRWAALLRDDAAKAANPVPPAPEGEWTLAIAAGLGLAAVIVVGHATAVWSNSWVVGASVGGAILAAGGAVFALRSVGGAAVALVVGAFALLLLWGAFGGLALVLLGVLAFFIQARAPFDAPFRADCAVAAVAAGALSLGWLGLSLELDVSLVAATTVLASVGAVVGGVAHTRVRGSDRGMLAAVGLVGLALSMYALDHASAMLASYDARLAEHPFAAADSAFAYLRWVLLVSAVFPVAMAVGWVVSIAAAALDRPLGSPAFRLAAAASSVAMIAVLGGAGLTTTEFDKLADRPGACLPGRLDPAGAIRFQPENWSVQAWADCVLSATQPDGLHAWFVVRSDEGVERESYWLTTCADSDCLPPGASSRWSLGELAPRLSPQALHDESAAGEDVVTAWDAWPAMDILSTGRLARYRQFRKVLGRGDPIGD